MTRKRRGLNLTPTERREIASLLEEMRAQLGDAASVARSELAELLTLWDEVIDGLPTSQGTPAATQRAEPPPRPGNPNTMITRADVARMLSASVSTIQRMENDGRLPKPRAIGARSVRHLVQDVEAFIARTGLERRGPPRGRLH
jgi:predicted DNA-binding transcriptional regulator AlpA